jgi:fatty acid desaturase
MPEWTLYGQTLDLEEFKKNHPGGDLALLLGEERDCTRLFEQYHCRNPSNQTVLKQLAAQQGKEINPTIQDPFQQDVLQMAYDHKGGYTASGPKLAFLSILGLALVGTWIGWACGSWFACFLLPFLIWVFGVNIVHDAAHFALCDSPWLNELLATLASPLLFNTVFWYLEHNLSHHTHTNEIGKDIDVHHGAPHVRLHSSSTWTPSNQFQIIMVAVLQFLNSPISETVVYPLLVLFKHPIATTFFGSYDSFLARVMPYTVLQFVFVAAFFLIPFLLFKKSKAIAFVAIPYVIVSLLFMTITQVSHIQEETQPAKPNENWMRQMVESSMDYSQDSDFWSLVTGGLNMQSLHHCLPAVDSSHLMTLYPKFRAICEKHGVKIHQAPSLWAAIVQYWSHIHNLSKKPKGEGCPVAR